MSRILLNTIAQFGNKKKNRVSTKLKRRWRILEQLESRQLLNADYFPLSSADFSQDWSNTGLITANDDWSGVPSIIGYLGQNIITAAGVDARTVTGDSVVANDIDVIADQTNTSSTSGGIAEFEIADPVVALQGSGTADVPYLQFHLDTTGRSTVRLTANLRDIDGSGDNSVQQINVQYRVGTVDSWTNVTGGYFADVSTGPSLATAVTPLDVTLPAAAENQAQVQVRVMTTNAAGSDEWIGIDDIGITSASIGAPTPGVTIIQSAGSTAVAEGGADDTYTIALTTVPAGNVQITVTPDSQTLVSADGTTFSPTPIVLTFTDKTAQTVTVRAVDDAIVEGDHSGTITHAITATADATDYPTSTTIDAVTATIFDNDFVGLNVPYTNDFETVAGAAGLGSGWTTFSVDTDSANTWFAASTTTPADRFAEVNGIGDAVPAEDWLISPPFDLTASTGEIITFETWTRFADAGIANPQVQFMVSTDYSGVGTPSAATWTDLPYTAAAENTQVFTPSGNIDASTINSSLVWFAFKYTSSGVGASDTTQWRVDDFEVQTAASVPDFAIAATDASKAEGNVGTTDFTFTVTRSGSTSGGDTVNYTVTGATADAADAADFTSPLSGTVTFLDGEAAKLVTLQVTGDTTQEPNEGFTVTLSNASRSGTISQASASGTIADDDAPIATVWINELDADTPGTDDAEFVELYDGGVGNTSLTGLTVVFYNGSNDLSYASFDLDGFTTDANGFFLLGNSSVNPQITFANNFLQQGSDAVAIYQGDATSFPNGTGITLSGLMDALVYDTNDADDPGLLVLLNNGQPQVDEAGGGDVQNQSIARVPDGGVFRDTSSYVAQTPSPGATNVLPVPPLTLDTEDTANTTLIGGWSPSVSVPGFEGANYVFARPGANATATFTPTIPTAGQYEVFVKYSSHPNRASNASVSIIHADGTFATTQNQKTGGGIFQSLGIFNFADGTAGKVIVNAAGSDGIVTADAVQFVRVADIVAAPSADLASPTSGQSLTAGALNADGFIDVTFTSTVGLDTATVVDAGAEFTISGSGVGTAVVSGAGVLQSGTTYRYSFTGSFVPGEVNVDFTPGSFANTGAVVNVADRESFTLTDGAVRLTLDNTDATQVNSWAISSAIVGYIGPNYLYANANGAGRLLYTPNIPSDGSYEVFVNYTDGASRASNAAYEVVSQNGTSLVRVDQRTGGGTYQSLGTFNFLTGTSGSVTLRASDADGVVVGDAVQFVRLGDLTGAPTATLADPTDGGSIVVTTINGRNYIDVTFTDTSGSGLEVSTITDPQQEFTLSGAGAAAVTVDGAASLVLGTTYRYATTGAFAPGAVDAVFAAGTFADLSTVANVNIDSIASFVVAEDVLEEVIVDNSDERFALNDPGSQFVTSTAVSGFAGSNYLAAPTGSTATATWTPSLSQAGNYQVFVRYTSHPLRASNATYQINRDGGADTVIIDQRSGGGTWVPLGSYSLTPGSASVQLQSTGANQYVVADAVRFVRVS